MLRNLSIALVIVIAFSTGAILGGKGVVNDKLNKYGFSAFAAGSVATEQPVDTNLTPLWKAWGLLDDKFVDAYATTTATTTKKDIREDQVWGLISGLAESMGDPYTVFLPPSQAEVFNADISGSFEGVGMEIAIRDRILTVVSPLKGTPAFTSGIKSADKIVKIDDTNTKDMSIGTAVQLIRGKKGTDVIFTIVREGEGELLDITVTRDTIQIPTIETYKRDDGIFVIELSNFSAKSSELFRQALMEFVETGYDKLIIDLRGNPGGYLSAATDMASWFLPTGKIVVTEDYGGNGENKIHRSRGYDIFEGELVILMDRGSASASEILAGSLKEHGVATLIGTRSFGKGSVQEVLDITSETSLKVTVARWLLAGDVFITKEGIDPDIEVEFPEEIDEDDDTDYTLERAVEYLLE